jgi:hypothetical protein
MNTECEKKPKTHHEKKKIKTHHHRDHWDCHHLMPNTQITPDVFAGLSYMVRVGSGIGDWYVTYTNEGSASGNYAQVAKVDQDKYKVGGEWHDTALWTFTGAEDHPGWFTLGVKSIPNGVLTWTAESSEGGHYVQIAHKYNDSGDYNKGGKYRDDALWGLWTTENFTWCTVGNKGAEVSSGYLTYSTEKSGSGYYLHLATSDYPKYVNGGEWRYAVLWRFLPTHYQIKEETQGDGTVKWTATADRFKKSNGKVVQNCRVGADVIKSFLKYEGKNIEITNSTADEVYGRYK